MSNKRTYKMSSLKDVVDKLSSRAFRRYGFARKEILMRWPEIVGSALAECCAPERLSFNKQENKGGTLHVRVEGSLALEIQHFEPIILERINGFYGYEAVAKLKLLQGPIYNNLRRKRAAKKIILTEEQKQELKEKLSGVQDKILYQTLFNLGASILDEGKMPPPAENHKKRFGRRGQSGG